jgi:hypothetical protein
VCSSDLIVQFEGSFGPRNCAVFYLDIDTNRSFHERDVECSSLSGSPDGKYIAYRNPVPMGDWDNRPHRVEIDGGPAGYGSIPVSSTPSERSSVTWAAITYGGADELGMHVETGPLWSDDSQRIAILERQLSSGKITVTTLSVRGEVLRVNVPASARDDPSLTWIGIRVAAGSGTNAVVVDPASGTYSPLDADSSVALEEVAQARQRARDERLAVTDIVKKAGAREGVARPTTAIPR